MPASRLLKIELYCASAIGAAWMSCCHFTCIFCWLEVPLHLAGFFGFDIAQNEFANECMHPNPMQALQMLLLFGAEAALPLKWTECAGQLGPDQAVRLGRLAYSAACSTRMFDVCHLH